MGKEKEGDIKLPGLPLEHFRAAVGALVQLQESGKCIVFLARRSSIKFVVDLADFQDVLSGSVPDAEITPKYARELLREARSFSATWERFREQDDMISFLEDVVYREELEELSKQHDQARPEFRKVAEAKIKLVDAQFMTDPLRERTRRLATATAACLEDVEFEVIEQRYVEPDSRNTKDPFLRLRLRYAEGGKDESFLSRVIPFSIPWGAVGEGVGVGSFELECDLSDIDLLVTRLRGAKDRLREALNKGSPT